MNAAEHRAHAEAMLAAATERGRQTAERKTTSQYLLEALVHAVLALAAGLDEEADQ